uniref:SERTA domain-containing protein 2-like isoform X1 n=2 Tax=Pristiophorus japonicus TaxID=55135 RepID=UPI00398EAD76
MNVSERRLSHENQENLSRIYFPAQSSAGREKEVAKVSSVLRFMLAKGLKRKLSDYEENMAGVPGAFDSNPGLPYTLQRQLVLNMCLFKLQSCRMLVEPNLHRSVLIANTVRQIQEEMRQESSHEGSNLCSGTSPIPDTYMASQAGIELTGMPSCVLNNSLDLNGSSDFSESQIENSLVVVSDDDMSSAISSILKDLDFMEDISPSPCPAPTGEDVINTDISFEDRPHEIRLAETVFGSFEITNSTSYLTDLAFDDIFEDIDTSMYDSDLCLLPSTSARSPPAIADDVPKPFQLCNSASVNAIQICRVDLSDLDHIMEILVGS